MRAEIGAPAIGKPRSRESERVPGRFPRWLRVAFWICIVIAVAAVLHRAVALVAPSDGGAPQQQAELDAYFVSHAALTWAHILSALAFVSLLPFLFWQRTRNSLQGTAPYHPG